MILRTFVTALAASALTLALTALSSVPVLPSEASAVRATVSPEPRAGTLARDDRRAEPDTQLTVPPASPTPAATPVPTIAQLITAAAHRFGQDPKRLLAVARCESSLRVNAVGDGGRSLGIFQYQARTFLEHARISGLPYTLADIGDPAAQSTLAAWAFSTGRASAWTCA